MPVSIRFASLSVATWLARSHDCGAFSQVAVGLGGGLGLLCGCTDCILCNASDIVIFCKVKCVCVQIRRRWVVLVLVGGMRMRTTFAVWSLGCRAVGPRDIRYLGLHVYNSKYILGVGVGASSNPT